jgi:aryl-alcohol dehydrogenase-like predicted oxidoreductase
MASGLLTGKMTRERIANLPHDDWRSRNPEYQEPRLSRNLAVACLLGEIGKAHNVPTGVVAIAWVLHNPAVTAAIVGARHPHQIEELVPASEFRLSENEYEQIRQFVAQHP